MDKKNVMLLTVIAVATLLVAVVGATFAYFSLTATTTGGTATATTTTQELGTITLNGDNKAMHIKLSAADMANYGTKKTYHATAGAETIPHVDSKETVDVAKATVVGGNAKATYTCNGNLKVLTTIKNTAAGTSYTLAEANKGQLSGSVLLEGTDVTFGAANAESKSYTLAETLSEQTISYKIVNLSSSAAKTILASASFDNTTDEQNDLQGKTITTTVTVDSVACTVDGNTTPAS